MKVTAIVPVHDFVGGLADICGWLRDQLPAHCAQHQALIWDDGSEPRAAARVRDTAERFGLAWTRAEGAGSGSLKRSLEHAARLALDRGHDAVLVCEHDAVPDDLTFACMLEVFRDPFREPLASVSPRYQWQGRDAYPTHPHWHTDGRHEGGRRDYPGIGTVTDVGAPGVPFLFSLWVPEVLAEVNRPEFPDVVSLDGTFGKYLHQQGYHHLRLIDVHIDHIGGGQRTWRPGHARRRARQAGAAPPYDVLRPVAASGRPRVSVVTTVYDRTDCLRQCLRTVRAQTFSDFEHLVVADHPPQATLEALRDLVAAEGDERTALVNLRSRHNNWGIAPAAAGLELARGEALCFLSDDNGYTAGHLEHLVAALDEDPRLGFVYSSCVYGNRGVLRAPRPRRSSIDLGQPLFRRQLFSRHLGDRLPFDDFFWDWHLIERFLRAGASWRHVDRLSFLYKLKDCPASAESDA